MLPSDGLILGGGLIFGGAFLLCSWGAYIQRFTVFLFQAFFCQCKCLLTYAVHQVLYICCIVDAN